MQAEKITALILAAGQSSRMGTLKPQLKIENKAVILWVIDAFQSAGIRDIRVVVGYHSEAVRALLADSDVKIITNPAPEKGMFSSAKAGVATLPDDVEGIFLVPADMPMIRTQTIKRLLKAHNAHPEKIIFPTFLKKRGHPPLITKACFKAIQEADESKNLRMILESFKANWLDLSCADNGILMDMDTQADYEKMVAYASTRFGPNMAECQALLDLFQVSDKIRKHCLAVSSLSCKLARSLNKQEERSVSEQILKSAALLHDVGKGQPNHALIGAKMVSDEGFYDLEEIIASHMHLDLSLEDFRVTEKELLYLSDKLTEEERYISLETRFENTLKKYPKAAVDQIFKKFYTAKCIKDKLEYILKRDNLYDFFNEGEDGGWK